MKSHRFLMMTATLLALATSVHAQGPADPGCPLMTPPAWLTQYLQQSMTTWQRVRTLCGSGMECCQPGCCKPDDCAVGVASGCKKCCEVAQTPASCGCTKACGCCESCKSKKDAAAEVQAVPLTPQMLQELSVRWPAFVQPPTLPMPLYVPMTREAPFPSPIHRACPFYSVCDPLGFALERMDAVDVQSPPGYHGVRVLECVPVWGSIPPPPCFSASECVPPPAPMVKHAHLVTPELEAHCHRMIHRGETILLEGDVMLLCKKHAQPIRIKAQRVIVNMKDGTFTVESDVRPSVSNFGVMRTSAVQPTGYRIIQVMPGACNVPANGPLEVLEPVGFPRPR
jgi:hypothetical protein